MISEDIQITNGAFCLLSDAPPEALRGLIDEIPLLPAPLQQEHAHVVENLAILLPKARLDAVRFLIECALEASSTTDHVETFDSQGELRAAGSARVRLNSLKGRALQQMLTRAGLEIRNGHGSHKVITNPANGKRSSASFHAGTEYSGAYLAKLLKQLGVAPEEFTDQTC